MLVYQLFREMELSPITRPLYEAIERFEIEKPSWRSRRDPRSGALRGWGDREKRRSRRDPRSGARNQLAISSEMGGWGDREIGR